MASKHSPLRLRIVCNHPPPDVWDGQPIEFGLQDQSGALMAGEPGENDHLIFECEINVTRESDPPHFLGPFTHGTPKDRFLYLSLRQLASDQWIRRIKIPLSGITREQIHADKMLEATVDGRRAARVEVDWH